MTTRIKAPSLANRAVFERAIDDLARATVALRKVEARRDARLQTVRAEFEAEVDLHAFEIETLTLLVEKYAEEHRDELLPGKAKSAETALAFFGFRLGNPTIKLLNKTWSVEKAIAAIKASWADAAVFIRVAKEELDKDALKRLDNSKLASAGPRIAQAETFFVEPKEQPTAQEARAS